MPKLKTNKGARKRFSLTKRGKVKARRSKMRHILSSKPKKQKRRLKSPFTVSKFDSPKVKKLLPYG